MAAGASILAVQPIVTAICLIALLVCFVIFRFPFSGLMAFTTVATLLPFAVLPIRVVFAPTLIDIVLTTLLAAWLFRVLRREEALLPTHVDWLLAVFLGLAVVALILGMGQSPIPSETLRLFLKFLNSTLLFFGVVQVVRTEQQVASVSRTLLLGGGAAACIALALYALPREAASAALSSLEIVGYPTTEILRPIARTETLRATGTSVDPNILGGLLMLVGVLLVAQILARKPVLQRPLLATMALLVAGALALTYSRGSWVGLAAGIAFLALGRQRRAILILATGFAAVLLLPQGRAIIGRLGEAFAATDQASVMRLEEYRNAGEIISRYPMFGIGFGGPPTVDLAVGVSSIYLLVAEQMGLVALTCFLGVVFAVLVSSWRARPATESALHGMVGGLEAAFVSMLVAGVFDHYFLNVNFPHMVGLFWLIAGLLAVTSRLSRWERPGMRRRREAGEGVLSGPLAAAPLARARR